MATALKVLVVDDNTYAREIAGALLNKLGITDIVMAESGAAAVGAILADRPDLVLLDWYMPEVSGAGLLQIIRDPRFGRPGLRVLLMTAYASRENIARARALGVSEVLIKPFNVAQLATALRASLPNMWSEGSATGTDDTFFL